MVVVVMVAVEQRLIECLILAVDPHGWKIRLVRVAHDVVFVDAVNPAAGIRRRELYAAQVVHHLMGRNISRPTPGIDPGVARSDIVPVVRAVGPIVSPQRADTTDPGT